MPNTELSPEESAALIVYARRKFVEEHYLLSPAAPDGKVRHPLWHARGWRHLRNPCIELSPWVRSVRDAI